MAIIRCPACGRRMSSLAKSCPNCHEAIGQLSDSEREKLAMRRWRTWMYRARNFTYLAMTLVVVGLIVWWLHPPRGLGLPVGIPAATLLGVGLIGYVASWSWMLWLRFRGDPGRQQ